MSYRVPNFLFHAQLPVISHYLYTFCNKIFWNINKTFENVMLWYNNKDKQQTGHVSILRGTRRMTWTWVIPISIQKFLIEVGIIHVHFIRRVPLKIDTSWIEIGIIFDSDLDSEFGSEIVSIVLSRSDFQWKTFIHREFRSRLRSLSDVLEAFYQNLLTHKHMVPIHPPLVSCHYLRNHRHSSRYTHKL